MVSSGKEFEWRPSIGAFFIAYFVFLASADKLIVLFVLIYLLLTHTV